MSKPYHISGAKKYALVFAHLGALITVAAWGCSFISTKVLMVDGGLTPVETYVYRFIAAYLVLLLFTFKRILAYNWKEEFLFLICGLCAGSLYFITENYALKYTSTGNVSLLASISPVFTTILMAAIYKVRMRPGVLLGSVIAFCGVGCVIFSSGEGFVIRPTGDLLALSAALSWAVYTIVVKRLIPIYNSFFITRKLFFYGVITALPLLFLQDAPLHIDVLFCFREPQYLFNFLFLVLMCSISAYLIWNEAMKVLGPVTSNNYLYLQPLITMIVAFVVFDEEIHFLGYVGCCMIIGGLIISDKLKWDYK
ncbi:MAG: DMT family transporter [Muribaculaceae bacterium]|nr:DMT family transporter [Muribaculaceae bacterium]